MEKLSHNMKRQVIFMWLFTLAIYLPFFLIVSHRYDVRETSLSALSWSSGDMYYLVVYLILALPSGVYCIFFMNWNFNGNYKWIYRIAPISCIFISIGAFIPFRRSDPDFFILNYIHTYVSLISTTAFFSVMMTTLFLCARKSRHKWLLYSLYAVFIIALFVGYFTLGAAAWYTFASGLGFLIILAFTNTYCVFQIGKKSSNQKE